MSERDAVEGFGPHLKAIRQGKGLLQRDLAQKLGVTVQAISQLEQGLREPSYRTLLGLADALGVSLDALRPGGSKPKGLKPPQCVICGNPINNPRPATTCSPECRAARRKQVALESFHRRKKPTDSA